MSGRTRLSVDGAKLEGITRGPLPASRKVYLRGTLHPEVRVPLRQIALGPTRTRQGQEHNELQRRGDVIDQLQGRRIEAQTGGRQKAQNGGLAGDGEDAAV